MLHRAGDAGSYVQFGPHRLARLSDLPFRVGPAGMYGRTRCPDFGPQHLGQRKHFREVFRFRQAAPAGHDEVGKSQLRFVRPGIGNEIDDLGHDRLFGQGERMLDDANRAAVLPGRHRHHARPHGCHLRPGRQIDDGAHQAAAKGRPTGKQRFVAGVDFQPGAIGGQPGEQSGRHRTGQIAPLRRRAQKQDFRLVSIHQLGHPYRVGLIAVIGQHVALHQVAQIGAIAGRFIHQGAHFRCGATEDGDRQLAAQGVGQLAPLAQQFPGHGMDMAVFVLDEHPDILVRLEAFGQNALGFLDRLGDIGIVAHAFSPCGAARPESCPAS